MTIIKFMSNSHVSIYNKDSVTSNVLDIAVPPSPVTVLRVVELRVERCQSRSTSYLVLETSGKFNLRAFNMNFSTRNEGVK